MRRLVLAVLLAVICLPALAGTGGDFSLADPAGDDFGPGTYIYPKNPAFEPYRGLFDLTSFSVAEAGGFIHFDLDFADLRNPWRAPEGFSHQQVEIYIHRGGGGRTETLRPGAYVSFSPRYPWDVMLRAAPWESSEIVLTGANGKEARHELQAGLAGPRRIRLPVPADLIGRPAASWRYYVLVGSYDGFGPDFFRPVMAKPGEWHFGGGRDDAAEPQVLDILAPERGAYSQVKQLGGYDPARKKKAELMPVGPGFMPGAGGGFPWTLAAVLLAALAAVGWWFWYAPEGLRGKATALAGRAAGAIEKLARRGGKSG
ncbi:MAG: glucodextranase DOMON-like domain-containing protein [Patescibacteria group bacterium]